MELLKRVVDATGAQVVLSTTWRKYWIKEGIQADSAGKCIQEVFDRFAIKSYDKTPVLPGSPRGDEIWAWLKGKYYIEGYVILDDQPLGWEQEHPWSRDLLPHFIQTNDAGDGLTYELAELAIQVLNGELLAAEHPASMESEPMVRKGVKNWLLRFLQIHRNK